MMLVDNKVRECEGCACAKCANCEVCGHNPADRDCYGMREGECASYKVRQP
jgi:hypothetical protein